MSEDFVADAFSFDPEPGATDRSTTYLLFMIPPVAFGNISDVSIEIMIYEPSSDVVPPHQHFWVQCAGAMTWMSKQPKIPSSQYPIIQEFSYVYGSGRVLLDVGSLFKDFSTENLSPHDGVVLARFTLKIFPIFGENDKRWKQGEPCVRTELIEKNSLRIQYYGPQHYIEEPNE